MENLPQQETSRPKINIEIASPDGSRTSLAVTLVDSGPLNESGVPAWHAYEGPTTGDTYRAYWNDVEKMYIADPMD